MRVSGVTGIEEFEMLVLLTNMYIYIVIECCLQQQSPTEAKVIDRLQL